MDERLEQALTAPYHRVFTREDDGGYSAFVIELPGVNAAGGTIEEANEDLENAIASWVELELERGHELPEPIALDGYSGRMQVRIPPSLHQRAQLVAQLEGVSLNRLISEGIALVVGERVHIQSAPSSLGNAAEPSTEIAPRRRRAARGA
jgi:antitoxin HicB